jgi:hypothetical protein
MRRPPTDQEKVFAKNISYKGLFIKYKEVFVRRLTRK